VPEEFWPVLPERIETERLVLRPWGLTDVGDVLTYARDPGWAQFLKALPIPYERKHAEEFVARQILLDRSTHPAWAIELEDGAVGGINLRLNLQHRRGEIGYSIARPLWNRGYMTEAAGAVVHGAFSALPELNRICAMADVRNTASQRVMKKIGMTREGVLRQNRIERAEPIDEAWYGILRTEWRG
jgi:ribosomal-protein-alanine N-acetyltransferase